MSRKFKYKKKIEDMTDKEWNEQQEQVMALKLPPLRVLEFKGTKEIVRYATDELLGICPATGLPDFYKIEISYIPDKYIPELKSLKFYFVAYREIPILHEHLLSKIYKDFNERVKPEKLKIRLDVAVRGGIHTTLVKGSIL